MKNHVLLKSYKTILKFLIKFTSNLCIKFFKVYVKVKYKLFINYKKIKKLTEDI